MKKEYIFPVVSVLGIDTMDLLSTSPYTGDDDEEDDRPGGGGTGGSGEHIHARCRDDYRSNSDFGSLW